MGRKKAVSKEPETSSAPTLVADLVARFQEHADAYHAGRYNETQIRREFIDPFFEALGWDVANKHDYAEAYKDVIHEDAINVGGATKAPDYCFRIGGVRKFFVEAKKPAVDIKADAGPAFQLRRYAWSAKLPLSILTDFEELAVYDCRVKPVRSDKASTARVLYFRYEEYPRRWDELASIFSREAILKGSFDKFAESSKRKRGTAQVDDAFLAEIEQWRDMLARNFALRNPGLTQRDLNFAVQRTIDRIVFLRICEDRGIEPYGTLQALTNGEKVYDRLFERFRRADERYNSGLFHFIKERGRPEEPDDLTPGLALDDKPLKKILTRLYYPDSPYEFSVLPADILGQVYEQFLGKVIRLTKGHRAVVEEKPEVRKAGGVYYTPTYIVDYIVKHTVGKLVEGKTPQQVGGLTKSYQPSQAKGVRPLTVLDPACGSGSFLLGAYQFLLDWYRDRYLEDGSKAHAGGRNPRLFQHPSGDWRLTTAERKRILLSHIHGVDIDSQAVETTKLSLLLKVLEGESAETIGSNLRLFHERALPDLAGNIKCGNSLIGPDFYNGQQLAMFDEEERLRINIFDWNAEFKGIMRAGGFDAVIGNPPYGATIAEQMRKYLAARHPFVSDVESSQYFLAAVRWITAKFGRVCFIVPNTLFLNVYAERFRQFLMSEFRIEHLLDLSDRDVFAGATVRTAIISLITGQDQASQFKLLCLSSPVLVETVQELDGDGLRSNGGPWITGRPSGPAAKLRDKVLDAATPLKEILDVSQGLIPYDKYRGHDEQTIKNRIWHADHKIGSLWKRELRGADVTRYWVCWNGKQWIKYGPWLGAPRKPRFFVEPRLLVREITDPKSGLLHVAYCEDEFYNNPGIINCVARVSPYSLLYLLAVLNSRLMAHWHFSYSPKARKGVFPKILVNDVRNLPIRRIDFSEKPQRTRHDRMVTLVQSMLDLHKQLATTKTAHAKTAIQRQIDATDRRIDQLVYELYGLTDDEIRIVEETTG